MDVRTFEAFNMRDAIKMVRDEFGTDAVILKTKEKDGPNGKGKIVEVTAVASKHSPRAAASFGAEAAASGQFRGEMRMLEAKMEKLTESCATRDDLLRLESGLREIKEMLLANLREQTASIFQGLSPALARVVRQLDVMGVDPARIAELVQYLSGQEAPESQDDEEASVRNLQNLAVRWMMKKIKIAPRWNLNTGSVHVQMLVGTTGVGKTSLAAKLATHISAKDGKKLGVISFDVSRLGASEQMRVLAKVINTPFETVSSAEECLKVIEKWQNLDVILLDTAGQNPKMEGQLQELLKIKSEAPCSVDCHLVCASTDRSEQSELAIKHFMKLGLSSLMFNKLDESCSYGEIFNLTTKWSIPIAYFGIGQRVPEDIERASRERVVERIFGL